MNKQTQRKAVLIALAALLAALVLYDQFGAGANAADTTETTVEGAYLQQAAVTDKAERLTEQTDEWERLLEDARRRFNDARDRMIAAPSADIASARLTQIIERVMSDLDLTLTVSDALPVRRPLDNEPIHVIGLNFSFSALNPDTVARLVDRLENLPEVRTNISRLQVSGPGRRLRSGLDVTIELRALAWITQGGA